MNSSSQSAEGGIDVFRIFDSLNWLPSMEVAIDEALKQNKFVEGYHLLHWRDHRYFS